MILQIYFLKYEKKNNYHEKLIRWSEEFGREDESEEVVFDDQENDNWDINVKDEKNFGMKILLINIKY